VRQRTARQNILSMAMGQIMGILIARPWPGAKDFCSKTAKLVMKRIARHPEDIILLSADISQIDSEAVSGMTIAAGMMGLAVSDGG